MLSETTPILAAQVAADASIRATLEKFCDSKGKDSLYPLVCEGDFAMASTILSRHFLFRNMPVGSDVFVAANTLVKACLVRQLRHSPAHLSVASERAQYTNRCWTEREHNSLQIPGHSVGLLYSPPNLIIIIPMETQCRVLQ
jgi:hypothetical protein